MQNVFNFQNRFLNNYRTLCNSAEQI